MEELKFHVRNVFIWFRSLNIQLPKEITAPEATPGALDETKSLSVFFSPATNSAEYVKVTDRTHLELIKYLKDGIILLKIAERLWADIPVANSESQQFLTSSWGCKFDLISMENIHKFLITAKVALQKQMDANDESVSDMLFSPFDLLYELHVPKVLKCLSMLSLIFPTAPIPDPDKVAQEKESISTDLTVLSTGFWKGLKIAQEYDVLSPNLRKKVILEYYESEKQYIDALIALDKVFINPLSKRADLISSKDLSLLFPGVKDLTTFHKSHFKNLTDIVEQAARQQDPTTKDKTGEEYLAIGKIILNMTQGFELYRLFCSGFFDAQMVKCRVEQKVGFREFLEARSSSFWLSNQISIPYRRLLRYPLQIQSILKCTAKEHADYMPLSKALGQLIKLMKEITSVKLKKRHAFVTSVIKNKIRNNNPESNEYELFTETGVLKPMKLGYLLYDGHFEVVSESNSTDKVFVMFFEKYLMMVKIGFPDGMYKANSDLNMCDTKWDLLKIIPALASNIETLNDTVTFKSDKWPEVKLKFTSKASVSEWNDSWAALTEKQKNEKLIDPLILTKYENSPAESEINTICDSLPNNINAITDERLFFWSLLMLSDCALIEPRSSTGEDILETDNPNVSPMKKSGSELNGQENSARETMLTQGPPNSIVGSVIKGTDEAHRPTVSSTTSEVPIKKKEPPKSMKFMDDSESEEEEKSSDEDSDEELFRNGLSIQQVKKNKKSRSKARAILGVGVAPSETPKKPKATKSRDQAIDDRPESKPAEVLKSEKRKNVGSRLFQKIKGPLFKFGAEKEETSSGGSQQPPSAPLPVAQPSKSRESTVTRLKQSSIDTRSIVSQETRRSEMINFMEIPDEMGGISRSTSKSYQKSELASPSASTISPPKLTLLPVYMEDKTAYKKINAIPGLTAQDVISQILQKISVSLDDMDFYNLYEETVRDNTNDSKKNKVRLMRDSNVMDLYDWWIQSGETNKILVLRREESVNLTLDRRGKQGSARNTSAENTGVKPLTNKTIEEEPENEPPEQNNSITSEYFTWSLKDSETLWTAMEKAGIMITKPLQNGVLCFQEVLILKRSDPMKYSSSAAFEDVVGNSKPNMLVSPPPSTPPPLPPSTPPPSPPSEDYNEAGPVLQHLIDPFATGAAENLEDSITKIVRHIEPNYVNSNHHNRPSIKSNSSKSAIHDNR